MHRPGYLEPFLRGDRPRKACVASESSATPSLPPIAARYTQTLVETLQKCTVGGRPSSMNEAELCVSSQLIMPEFMRQLICHSCTHNANHGQCVWAGLPGTFQMIGHIPVAKA